MAGNELLKIVLLDVTRDNANKADSVYIRNNNLYLQFGNRYKVIDLTRDEEWLSILIKKQFKVSESDKAYNLIKEYFLNNIEELTYLPSYHLNNEFVLPWFKVVKLADDVVLSRAQEFSVENAYYLDKDGKKYMYICLEPWKCYSFEVNFDGIRERSVAIVRLLCKHLPNHEFDKLLRSDLHRYGQILVEILREDRELFKHIIREAEQLVHDARELESFLKTLDNINIVRKI
jgi:hypothetical protein